MESEKQQHRLIGVRFRRRNREKPAFSRTWNRIANVSVLRINDLLVADA